MGNGYVEVSVVASSETEEGVCDYLFSEGALGLVTEDLPGEPTRIRIRASFPGTVPVGPLVERLRVYQESLQALGLCRTTGTIEVRIDPAMAFGTGHHATTRMCLEALEAFMDGWPENQGGPVVLDVGTGTGILAIAATFLGAKRVVAIDTDPEACDAARKNLALTAATSRVQVLQGGIEALGPAARFDLVLANLDTRTLCPLLNILSRVLAPRGQLIASGIPVEDEATVTAAVQAAPLRIVERRAEDGWLCLTLVAR